MLRWKYSGWCLVSVLAFGGASVSRAQSNTAEVTSPDHRITLRFAVQPGKGQEARQDGQLVYSVSFHEKQVFENSALGLELANQPPLGRRCSHCRHHTGFRRRRLHAARRQGLCDPRRLQQPDGPRCGEARAPDASSTLRRAFTTAQSPSDITSPSRLRCRGISSPRRTRNFVP